jgi:DNA-binding transcriptional regulator YiaG
VRKVDIEAKIEYRDGSSEILKVKESKDELKAARKIAGLTQRAMSELLGIPSRTIQDWEAGKRIPPDYVKKSVLEKLDGLKK